MSKDSKKTKKKQEQKQSSKENHAEQTEALSDELEIVKQEKQQLFEKLQRVSADFENFQKREPKRIADAIAFEKEVLVKAILPVMDNFEHALADSSERDEDEGFFKGVKIVYEQLLGVLKSFGVEKVSSTGEKFDPAMHEAMMQRHQEGTEAGMVLEEYQKAYTLNGRVIRPGKVVVSTGENQNQANGGQSQDKDSE